ncbi:hypothetical protein GQ44DRAFT_389494 [Phaeosphaeriaceae sp. PMI808]|nr:hypothetical protein GQ44DRAFT_389494 [Phaeosphaeriaceae sp. PMI808]
MLVTMISPSGTSRAEFPLTLGAKGSREIRQVAKRFEAFFREAVQAHSQVHVERAWARLVVSFCNRNRLFFRVASFNLASSICSGSKNVFSSTALRTRLIQTERRHTITRSDVCTNLFKKNLFVVLCLQRKRHVAHIPPPRHLRGHLRGLACIAKKNPYIANMFQHNHLHYQNNGSMFSQSHWVCLGWEDLKTASA